MDGSSEHSAEYKGHQPRILSPEEIDLYIKGDRREIDRLILFGLNRLAAAIIPHTENQDKRDVAWDLAIEGIGGLKAIVKRAEFVDTLIKKSEEEAELMREAKRKIMLWGLSGFVLAVSVVLVFYWNAHVPHTMQLPIPTGIIK